jgi:Domain of unknown function (DUF5615)
MKLAADHNFNEELLRILQNRLPDLDLVRVRDVSLARATDEQILAWTSTENRVLLTHDVSTLIDIAYARLDRGLQMTGVIAIPARTPINRVIDDLEILIECSLEGELNGQVVFLPIK